VGAENLIDNYIIPLVHDERGEVEDVKNCAMLEASDDLQIL
jgi:hypothetical protein